MEKELKSFKAAFEYKSWRKWFEFWLKGQDLFKHLESNDVPTEEKEKKKHLKERNRVMAILWKCIHQKYSDALEQAKTPKDVIESLDKLFCKSNFEDIEVVERKLNSFKHSFDAEKMFVFLRSTISKYKSLDGDLSDNQIAKKIINEFPDNVHYLHVKSRLREQAKKNKNKYNLDEVLDTLEEVARSLSKPKVNKNFEKKLTFKTTTRKGVCKNCGKPGHFASSCRNEKKSGRFCYICGDEDHLANQCKTKNNRKSAYKTEQKEEKKDENNSLVQWSNFIDQEKKTNDENFIIFCLDSGTTSHCTAEEIFLQETKETDQFTFVNSFGETSTGSKCGTIYGQLDNGTKLKMQNVLHSKQLAANLISVHDLTKNQMKVIFEEKEAKIFDSNNNLVYRAIYNGKFYEVKIRVNINTNLYTMNNISIWHQRLGHISKDYIRKMKENNLVEGLDVNLKDELQMCHGCSLGKLKKTPVKSSINYAKTDFLEAKETLDRLCLDFVGPYETQSRRHFKGFISITDQFSRFRWVILLKSKAEASQKLCDLFLQLMNRNKKKIRSIYSDQGTEFINAKLKTFLKNHGITSEVSNVRTPAQNGTAERTNGLIQEGARCMLHSSGLPKKFWEDAVQTKCYLLNRSYSKPINCTPFEKFYGKKPIIKHLKIFGSRGYAQNLKPQKGKLKEKANRIIMLGYATNQKGYVVLNLENSRVEVSSSCSFDETLDEHAEKKFDEFENNCLSKKKETSQVENSETNFETVEEESLLEEQKAQNNKIKNFCDLDAENILNSGTGIKTRSQINQSNFQFIYLNKVEKFLLPRKYSHIIQRQDRDAWEKAYDLEMEKMMTIGQMKVVTRPCNQQVIPLAELFSEKNDNIKGNIKKVRFVARGDLEKQEQVKETYSPVISIDAIRIIIAVAAKFKCKLRQADVSAAFLHGDLRRKIYVELPQKLRRKYGKNKCWESTQALYGLADAPRAWNLCIHEFLIGYGFKQCQVEESLYCLNDEGNLLILVLYVDDLLYFSPETTFLEKLEASLKKNFKIKFKELAEKFVGVEIRHHDQGIEISQNENVEKMLETFEMRNAKPAETPMETLLVPDNEGKKLEDIKLYQSILGSLSYLMLSTRPDLSYSVNSLSRYNKSPSYTNIKQLKRILRYLKKFSSEKLNYSQRNDDFKIEMFVDSEHGKNKDCKSTYGYIAYICGVPVCYKTKKLPVVTTSSTESEFLAISESAKKLMWIKNIFEFLGIKLAETTLWNDNRGAVLICKKVKSCLRTRHINIRHFHVRELIENEEFEVKHISGEENIADGFTKSLGSTKFTKFRNDLFHQN